MKYKLIIFIAIVQLLFISCRKDFEFQNFDYKTYNRVVGAKGGILNFYANYDNDAKNEVIVKMEVPAGALDSLMVFNMYQFQDYELTKQMEDGFAKFGSKLLYFVPFYESEGYHDREQFELNYHLSVEFEKPITVTYYPLADFSDAALKNWQEVELYNNYYKSTNKAYKVYRIEIPKIDEWGANNNIFVNWTRQGYPNGYDATDLSYIVNGRWTASDIWSTGEISMENWEQVAIDSLNTTQDFVKFKIYDTDHIYIIARDIYLAAVPPALALYVASNFSNLQVKRASYDQDLYKLFLSDNSVAVFSKYQGFQYRVKDDLALINLPTPLQAYIPKYYPGKILKISLFDYGYAQKYEVILETGVKLTFDGDIYPPSQVYQYGYDPAKLSDSIKTYLKTNYPGKLINNVVYSNQYNYIEYIVYLSSNQRVYFDAKGSWIKTYYYKINSKEMPTKILEQISKLNPNPIYSEINYTIWPNANGTSGKSGSCDVTLANNKWFSFDWDTGELLAFEYRNLKEDALPQAVKSAILNYYPRNIISNIFHTMDKESGEWYQIYFTDLTSVYIRPNGSLQK